ncbi:PIN domain-containing protein [Nocardia sp. NPDC058519]|uniref:PIN domain-containing protein n=1 Tax=Nocardia sp. NPDC058519 TaxID=3346535 RepID=UPI0036518D58
MKIVVPEVVFMETVNTVRRDWEAERGRVAALEVGEFGFRDHQKAIMDGITKDRDEYEQWLRDRLTEVGVPVVTTPQVEALELARRAMRLQRPYRKTTDGLRDTLIWLTAAAVAEENPGEKVWFLSDNHQDFGQERVGKDAVNPNEACPFPLHPDLATELADRGLSGRVEYVVKMERLIRYFESLFSPIVDTDLASLTSGLNWNLLADLFVATLAGWGLDPERAALPLETVAATVVGSGRPTEGWRFSDGAGRGEDGWTARFSVDTEIDLALLGEGSSRSIITKQVRVSGDILVSLEGEIQSLGVTSVEALPDDPMRARWERRAEGAPLEDLFARYAKSDVFKNSIAEVVARVAESDAFKHSATEATGQWLDSDVFNTAIAEVAARYAESEVFKNSMLRWAISDTLQVALRSSDAGLVEKGVTPDVAEDVIGMVAGHLATSDHFGQVIARVAEEWEVPDILKNSVAEMAMQRVTAGLLTSSIADAAEEDADGRAM